LNYIFIIIC
jgi:hypothetical protein